MIAYVKGHLASIQNDSVIVDVNGIGYEIICPNPFDFQSSLNQFIKIHTYHHVREDLQALYGFTDEDEKQLFMHLISVSGIGPKSALTILAHVNVPEFVAAIEREDDKFLTSFPGIGKKTARQIILDLKGKLTSMYVVTADSASSHPDRSSESVMKDVQEALKALGYMDREIQKVIPKLRDYETEQTDEIIKKALALLMKQ